MEEVFKIYVEQLRNGHVEQLDETVSTEFLNLGDDEVRFDEQLHLSGEVYLAENELVIHLHVTVNVYIPCSICNTPVKILMDLNNLYLAVEPEDYKTGIFLFNELLRESILLEIPLFAECNEGECPKRKEISDYLSKPENATDALGQDHGYRPFADLDFDEKVK